MYHSLLGKYNIRQEAELERDLRSLHFDVDGSNMVEFGTGLSVVYDIQDHPDPSHAIGIYARLFGRNYGQDHIIGILVAEVDKVSASKFCW